MGVTEAPLIMTDAPLFMEWLPMSGMDPPMIVRMGRVDPLVEPLYLPHPPAPGPALHRLAFKVKWYMFV